MDFKTFKSYFYTYYRALMESEFDTLNNKKFELETYEKLLWEDYGELFAQSFIYSYWNQYEISFTMIDYFNYILNTFAEYYQSQYEEFTVEFYSKDVNNITYITMPINLQNLESLYTYFTTTFIFDHVFFNYTHYEATIKFKPNYFQKD